MQVKEIKQDGLSHEMEVTLGAKDIDARIDQRLEEVSKTVSLPGFRKGKVPMAIMKQKYGRSIMGEVLEAAVNETSVQALKDRDLEPAMQPKIEVKEFDEGKDLVFSMNVEVLPKFDIVDFKGMKLEKLVSKPEDKSVDEALERLAENAQTTQKVEEDRETKDGDTVLIDFDGRTADDDVHHDGMKAEGHKLKLGSGSFIPGFEEQLVGLKAGSDVEVKVSFPEEYGAKELAGRDAIFAVQIHEIHEAAEAKIDDEFAKNFGMDSLDKLKEAITEQLQGELDNQSRMIVKKTLLDALDEQHTLDVPPTMLDMEHQNILDQIKLEKQRGGEEAEELSDEETAEFKDIAGRRVRLGLILSAIGKANNIVVNDMELQKAVISEAQKYPGQEKEVFDYYSKNRNALESMRAPLFEEKVVDYILELADVSEKEISQDDLVKALDEDAGEEKPKKKAAAKKKPAAKKKAAAKKDGEAKTPAKKKPAAKKKAAAK